MESIADVLFSLYRGTPQHSEWVLACLGGAWPALLGERLAQVCRPTRLEGFALTIQIIDPTWEAALRAMQEDMREKIRTATRGEVRQIHFTLIAAG